jgi:subtilisin family serine protease
MKVPRLALAAAVALLLLPGVSVGRSVSQQASSSEYVVLYADGASVASAHQAIKAARGTLVKENLAVGVATVRSSSPTFVRDVARQSALDGAARNVAIGRLAPEAKVTRNAIDRLTETERAAGKASTSATTTSIPGAEPLAGLQWDMAMIHATPEGSYATQPGQRGVRVGILDTGVDGTHPDIAPNFDLALSRNFVTDMVDIDGPCEYAGCVDPANHDDGGHGTHVAGTVAAAMNGLGIAGVAPNVTIVNIRAGQDSGYFFLQPSVDALTYAADNAIDVVNMSYYIDPWLYNCKDNPADSAEQQLEQQTIIKATNRALDYAHKHGVTLIAAEGNGHTNLDNVTFDGTSPDYPPNTEYDRTITKTCPSMPADGHHVINVGAVGPSTIKSDYSNWGKQDTDVTAPGGYFRDGFGTPTYRTNGNLVLSTMPENVALAEGAITTPGGPVTPAFEGAVIRDCSGGTCGYYQYLQGTSMASPHAVGVAALIVSQWGKRDGPKGSDQLKMSPGEVEKILKKTATDHACPDPALISYTNVGRPASYDALCEGSAKFNNIWGEGIVDALAAVTSKK